MQQDLKPIDWSAIDPGARELPSTVNQVLKQRLQAEQRYRQGMDDARRQAELTLSRY